MLYEKDYIMRLIHEIVRTLVKLVFGIDEEKEEVLIAAGEVSERLKGLLELAEEGKINQAENLLFENLDCNDMEQLKMGLLFYQRINEYSDEYLEENNYSREEIKQGIEMLLKAFQCKGLIEMLLMENDG